MEPNLFPSVIESIYHADDTQLDEISKAVVLRFRELHPGWDSVYFTIPRYPEPKETEMMHKLLQFLATL